MAVGKQPRIFLLCVFILCTSTLQQAGLFLTAQLACTGCRTGRKVDPAWTGWHLMTPPARRRARLTVFHPKHVAILVLTIWRFKSGGFQIGTYVTCTITLDPRTVLLQIAIISNQMLIRKINRTLHQTSYVFPREKRENGEFLDEKFLTRKIHEKNEELTSLKCSIFG